MAWKRRPGASGSRPSGPAASAKKSPLTSRQRSSDASPAPSGTRPRRCQSMTSPSVSTTISEATRGSSSAARAVYPRPRPPTATSSGVSGSSARPSRVSSVSPRVKRLDIRNSSPSFTSYTSSPDAGSRLRRRLMSPMGVGCQSISWKRALIAVLVPCPWPSRRPWRVPQRAPPAVPRRTPVPAGWHLAAHWWFGLTRDWWRGCRRTGLPRAMGTPRRSRCERGGGRGRQAADLRGHQPPRRGQVDDHRGPGPARARHHRGGRRAREVGSARGRVRLDGDGEGARYLRDIGCAPVRPPRPCAQPPRHPRSRGLLRGHLPGACGGRLRGDAHRRGQGARRADPQALRRLPAPPYPGDHLRQQVGPAGPGGPGAAGRDRARAARPPHPGDLAGRRGR